MPFTRFWVKVTRAQDLGGGFPSFSALASALWRAVPPTASFGLKSRIFSPGLPAGVSYGQFCRSCSAKTVFAIDISTEPFWTGLTITPWFLTQRRHVCLSTGDVGPSDLHTPVRVALRQSCMDSSVKLDIFTPGIQGPSPINTYIFLKNSILGI